MSALRDLLVICLALGVSMGEDFDYSSSNYRKPPAQILLHKQALTKDGNFNFVFTSENGLKQGETIRPDGTRQGGYSYVDPDGNTHTIKYIAGKDGFKILENNAPKAPEVSPQYERILNQHQQIRQQQAQTARDAYDRPITKEYNRPPVTDPFQQQPISNEFKQPIEERPTVADYDKPTTSDYSRHPINDRFKQPITNFIRPSEGRQTNSGYDQPADGGRSAYEQTFKSPFTPQDRNNYYQQQLAKYTSGTQNSSPSKTQYRVQEESRPQYSGYQEEHKGPHNYGSGYSFEFSG